MISRTGSGEQHTMGFSRIYSSPVPPPRARSVLVAPRSIFLSEAARACNDYWLRQYVGGLAARA